MRDIEKVREINSILVRKGIRQSVIARGLGIARQQICDVIAGRKRNDRVVKALVNVGIPQELFSDPDEETEKAA